MSSEGWVQGMVSCTTVRINMILTQDSETHPSTKQKKQKIDLAHSRLWAPSVQRLFIESVVFSDQDIVDNEQ